MMHLSQKVKELEMSLDELHAENKRLHEENILLRDASHRVRARHDVPVPLTGTSFSARVGSKGLVQFEWLGRRFPTSMPAHDLIALLRSARARTELAQLMADSFPHLAFRTPEEREEAREELVQAGFSIAL